MKHALEMLAGMPGVRHVMLVTEDGVPIAVSGRRSQPATSRELDTVDAERPAGTERPAFGPLGTEDALAALAIGLLGEFSQAVGQMSWSTPARVVLKAARGTLVLQTMRGAVLLVLLARGLSAEETRLSMDGTIARIERSLRSMHQSGGSTRKEGEPPGPIPSAKPSVRPESEVEVAEERGNGNSPEPRY